MLRRDLQARGIAFFTNAQTEAIVGGERVEGVRLADGRQIAGDLAIIAIGIRPNVDLAASAGLNVNRGILVGDDMRTTEPETYAVGECVEHNGRIVGRVAPIWEQAEVCGARLAGDEAAVYRPSPVVTSLKITGVNVFSAGALAAEDDADEGLALHDPRRGIYKKLVLRDGRIVGCVLYGDVADGSWYLELMRDKGDVSAFRDRIVFGRDFAAAA
jgi:nitrite reductase (NADH) large subunit